MKRCGWVKENNPLYVAYHDEEWGRPVKEDQVLFELLCLESYQAGLSWETILNKRTGFRQAFHDYDVLAVAQMSDSELESLLENPAIVRHRAKIFATRQNAQAFLKVREEYGTFADYLWSWVNFTPVDNHVKNYREAPSKTNLSEQLSKDLKKRGFTFVGPVCAYSYMQATGLVNDHEVDCEYH
ncbi:3-methyladenine DNA glycosylase [Streptococcus cuniculi]|uniref:3-methyladenine DNA glycosylase n=1 Tax=Streptococcus cuniculi TaxID=1432788 RepID=A0A1Q8E6S2_9STRE|nr:DNA-3-methyladenine glycosylase I [Streptococcus cuniculi]OLF47480.1 3-methyladenine DNA glycosylase [Streptococcus cuniculi]